MKVVVQDELVSMPPVVPLDAVVELRKEPRRRLGELLGDLADEPAVQS